MEKLYCLSVKKITNGQKTFYVANVCSGYGFIQDVFVNEDMFNFISNEINDVGFVDVTNDFHLQYDKKLDKLVYALNK